MTNTIVTRSSLEAAMNNPMGVLSDLYEGTGLLSHMEEIFAGVGGIETLSKSAFGAEGEAPAGFFGRADEIVTVPGVSGLTVDGQNVNEIWTSMQAALRAFNLMADAVTSYFTYRTTSPNEKVGVPTSPGFQKATEYGRPSKVRVKMVARGIPLDHFDIGDGYTQEFIDDATGAQLLAVQSTILNSWAQLNREIVLAALFGNTNYVDKDQIAVKRLYNADGEVPPAFKRWTFDGTHSHYLTSGSATLAVAHLETLAEELIHHGFKELGGTLILHAHRDDVNKMRALTGWIPAETSGIPAELAASGVIVGRRGTVPAGLVAEGWIGEWVVVENNDIPADYLVGQVTGGQFSGRNPVGLRSHQNESIRGLRLIEGNRKNYPLYESVYDGYTGAGVGQRGACAVMKVTAGAYDVPAFMTGE